MKKREYSASALVVTLLVLAVILVTAMSVSLVSIKERSISSNAAKSSQAFQNADSGEEIALEKIKSGWTSISDFTNGGMTCNNGIISGNLANGKYELTFKDSSNTPITTCNNTNTIASIKSVGEYKENQRVIEAAVAADGQGLTKGCRIRIRTARSGITGPVRDDTTSDYTKEGEGWKCTLWAPVYHTHGHSAVMACIECE